MAIDSKLIKNTNIAIVHDWLTDFGGAEVVLEAILSLFPDAPVYTLVYQPEQFKDSNISRHPIHTSFIQKLPWGKTKYRSYLLFMPLAVEQFDLSQYDVVISSNYAVAKGVITGPDQLHISYVHSPIRYAWDLQHQYLKESKLEKGLKSWIARWVLHKIRLWDYRTSCGVDTFIANSNFIARRIKKVYGRKSTVIYPPVDTEAFTPVTDKDDFYLTVSRIVPYKKIRLIVDAFSKLPGKNLVVIGDGPEYKNISAKAYPNITFLGRQNTNVVIDHMQRAKAFIFAAEEDFGIVSIEAQACGTPVLAYGKGGALETVVNGKSGLLFFEQNTQSILDIIHQFEKTGVKWNAEEIRQHAKQFSKKKFLQEISQLIISKHSSL